MRTASPLHPKKVVIVIDMSAGASARDVLSGVFKYVNMGTNWSLRIVQPTAGSLAMPGGRTVADDSDGMIVTMAADDDSNRAIAEARVPVVFADVRHPLFERRDGPAAYVRNDNEGIGRAGARYLAALGHFNSFGYVADTDNGIWSALRERAFVAELRARGFRAHVLHSEKGRTGLVDWLRELPKPAALMAAWDLRAVQVVEACVELGLSIPGQVAVLGVDDDDMFCHATTPPLSSIRPDHVNEGFLAAVELERLFRLGVRAKRRETFCYMRGIAERESTKAGPPTAALVNRALAFIDANLRTDLHVETLSEGLGVSRRLLERRFREARNETIHDYILDKRLAIVRHLLRTTRRSCAKIAAECGFPSANSLSHVFKRKVGCSMRTYRFSKGSYCPGGEIC